MKNQMQSKTRPRLVGLSGYRLFPSRMTHVVLLAGAMALGLPAFVSLAPAVSSPRTGAPSVTFIPIGFLSGDDFSDVYAVNDSVSLAGCTSYHRDPVTSNRVFNFAARWTPIDGLQPLSRLPNTSEAEFSLLSFVAGRDITADGNRIAFTAPTEDQTGRAAGISDPDGSNLIALTSLPNGEKMQVVNQLSDDGLTAFGLSRINLFGVGSFWTSASGIQSLVPLAGYTNVSPSGRAISSNGTVSAGDLFNYDPNILVITSSQAYRWTSSGGVQGIGFLPGGENSSTLALTPDGAMIMGTSSTAADPHVSSSLGALFLWSKSDGFTDLGRPQLEVDSILTSGGLSADGQVATAAFPSLPGGPLDPLSFILRIGYPFYFAFEDVLTQAGAGGAIDGWSSFFINGITDDGNTVFGSATNPDGKKEGFMAQFTADYLRTLVAPLPQITSSLTAEVTLGEYFVYVISATGMPESFDAENLPPGLTVVNGIKGGTTIREGIIKGIPTVLGKFPITISATNVAGTTSATLILTDHDSPVAPKLLNISTRAAVLTGDNVLIGGFIVTGNEPKQVVLRAIGPSLAAFGITSPLLDPVIELHEEDGTILTNDNWKVSQQTEIEAAGFAPADDRESALIATLSPGAYTAIVSGKGGGTGVGLVEAYDLDQTAQSRLANISTRGFVDTGDNVLIGGVIVASAGATVVVRAIGPSLETVGVTGALQDPLLEIHNPDGSILVSNDDWRETQEADIEASGIAPTDDRESTIIVTLTANNYTAIVRGKNDGTGVALVEAYNVD